MTANSVKKDAVAGDTHVTTALGNEKDRQKARLFNAFIGKPDPKDLLPTKKGENGDVPPHLKPMDDEHSHTPFPYDANALGKLREDQVPRFFGALTDPDQLDDKRVPLDSLVAMQNRVHTGKVEAARQRQGDKPAVVVRFQGRNHIADGHHRLSAAYLNGETHAKVKFKNLDPQSNTMKCDFEVPFAIKKADDEQRLIFGWASMVEKNGQLVIDKQGDIILPHDLERAAYDFTLTSRQQGDMHKTVGVGRLVESMVFTKEKQDALGIALPDGVVGWWVGFKVDNDEVWAAHKRGDRPEFSIGGMGHRVEV